MLVIHRVRPLFWTCMFCLCIMDTKSVSLRVFANVRLQGMLVHHSAQHLQDYNCLYNAFVTLLDVEFFLFVQALKALDFTTSEWSAKSSMFIKLCCRYRWPSGMYSWTELPQ